MKRVALIEKLEDRAAAGSMLISLPGGLLSLLPDVMPNLPYSLPQPEQDARSRPAATSRGAVATDLPKSALPASTTRPMRHPRNASPLLPTDQLSSNSPTRRVAADQDPFSPWSGDADDQDATRNYARQSAPLFVTPESSGGGSSGSSSSFAGAGFAGSTDASGSSSAPASGSDGGSSAGYGGEGESESSATTDNSDAAAEETKHGGTEATEPSPAPPAPATAPQSAPPSPPPITLRDFPPDLASGGGTTAESGGTAPHAGTVTVVDGDAVLCEGNSFLVTLSYSFTVPENSGDLTFTYTNLNLDTTDTAFINDAFEVALVDQDGFSIVSAFSPSRDAFFNIAEELPAALGPYVTHDAQTVTVSMADVPPGLEATLIFRLVNNDSDMGSCVTLTGVGGVFQNDPPVLDPLTALQAAEGTAVSLSATFSDSGTQDTHTAAVDWGDGTTSPAIVTGADGQGTVSAEHIYADNGVHSVTLTVTDNSQDSATTTATIANVAPAMDATLSFEAVLVEARYHVGVVIAGVFTDPGFDHPPAGTQEQFTVQIDWGDGMTGTADVLDAVQGSPGILTAGVFTAAHTYSVGGTYDAVVTLCDDDGGCVSQSFRYGIMLIDIKPAVRESGGSGYDATLPEGLIPVVMFAAPTLAATQIAPLSLRFYPGAAPEWDSRLNMVDAAPQDERIDAVAHFSTWDARIPPTDHVGWVVGQLSDGTPLLGVDVIGVNPASARIPFAYADLPEWLRVGTPWAVGEGESSSPLAPVLRGEGWGEGPVLEGRNMDGRNIGEFPRSPEYVPATNIPAPQPPAFVFLPQAEGESFALSGPNPANPLDVNADGASTPLDALLLINALNAEPALAASSILAAAPAVPTVYLDVTGDGLLTPLDALWVINGLNLLAQGLAPATTPAPSPVVDLTIGDLATNALVCDGQALTVSGTISATVENQGPDAIDVPFSVLFFEDLNINQAYDSGIDNILGSTQVTTPFAAGPSVPVTAQLSGHVQFSGNVIWGFVDSRNEVAETVQANNLERSSNLVTPDVGSFNPVVEWSKRSFSVEPQSYNVAMTPAVVDLDANGVPDIVFTTYAGIQDGSHVNGEVLRAIRGDNGAELWNVTDPRYRVEGYSGLAVGDIDLDGRPEIIANHDSDVLIAFEHDGTFKWKSPPIWGGVQWGSASIADVDVDGIPEVVLGATVLNNDGTIRWEGNAAGGQGRGGLQGYHALSAVADLDLDGVPEVIGGKSAYRADGSLHWNSVIPDGFPGIGNFDADPNPEVVVVSNGYVYILEHDDTLRTGPIGIPGGGPHGNHGGPPTIADVDGDGEPEIGVAGASQYVVYETNGAVKWSTAVSDYSSSVTGSSVFDFEGDGRAEVIYGDEYYLRIYRGVDGSELF
jgi:hypothetical protein